MIKIPTNVQDCYLIGHTEHSDNRGGFKEIFRQNLFREEFGCDWVQNNFSYSYEDVLRGLHVVPFHKIVGCLSGTIYDVVVDVRKDSPTYLQYFATYLNVNSNTFVYVPPGCGHGFLSLEDKSVLFYMQSDYYEPSVEQIFNFKDPAFNIYIPAPKGNNYIISGKDGQAAFI